MTTLYKALFLGAWLFIGLPLLAALLLVTLQSAGVFILLFLGVFWCWEVFAFYHYEHARRLDFLHLMRTATDTQAPVEQVLNAYLRDCLRPRGQRAGVNVLFLIFFPGFYWGHLQTSFDTRLQRLVDLLERGVTLDRALTMVPGLVSRETAMAVTVGQFGGNLPQALQRLPDCQRKSQRFEMATKFAYPLVILCLIVLILSFLMIFIIPKFERIFMDFRMKLPYITEILIAGSRGVTRYWFVVPVVPLLVWAALFSWRTRWYYPLVGRFFQMHDRGQFLQLLGLMLETGEPLPEILFCLRASELLPTEVKTRADSLTLDLLQGQALAESLARHELVTAPMQGLIASAEKAHNLPWALQELGETLSRRCAMITYRLGMVAFPLTILACACVVGAIVLAIFMPLPEMLDGVADFRKK